MAQHARHHRVRPLRAALKSMLVPGWGQLEVGRRRLGWSLIAVAASGVAGLAVLLAMAGVPEVMAPLTDPDVLLAVVGADLVVAAIRVMATAHAWFAAGGRSVTAVLVLVAVTLAPHAAVAYLGLETRGTLVRVFAPQPGTTSTTSTTSADSTSASNSTPTSTNTTVVASSTTMPDPTVPSTEVAVIDPIDSRYNVLLLGGDAGRHRSGLRTDSIILVSVDLASGDAAMFSVPRNWTDLSLSDGRPLPHLILNEVYQWGRLHPDGFGTLDPGASAVVDVVGTLTGVPIDHFVLVDLTAFAAVVDALGGVTLDVPRAVYGPRYDPATGGYTMILIPRGEQTLDGGAALAYARERYQSSDYDRMDRQRCLLAALAAGVDPLSLLTGLPGLLDAIEQNVTTDISLDQVPGLVRLSSRVDVGSVRMIRFDTSWAAGYDSSGYTIPDVERVQNAIATTITDPTSAEDGGPAGTAASECG